MLAHVPQHMYHGAVSDRIRRVDEAESMLVSMYNRQQQVDMIKRYAHAPSSEMIVAGMVE